MISFKQIGVSSGISDFSLLFFYLIEVIIERGNQVLVNYTAYSINYIATLHLILLGGKVGW